MGLCGRGIWSIDDSYKKHSPDNQHPPRVLTKTIKSATKPILSIDWGKPLVREIGSKTIDEMILDLRSTGITSGEYTELVFRL